MTSTTFVRFKCNRCRKELEMPKEGNRPRPLDGWLQLSRKDMGGSLDFYYHLCDECSPAFNQFMVSTANPPTP